MEMYEATAWVECLLQLPPLADGSGRHWLLQRVGGLRGPLAEEGLLH